MAPKRETEEDLEKEAEVAAVIANKWKCEPQKMPYYYILDFQLKQNDKIMALVEVKCRDTTGKHDFETYMMDQHCIKAMIEYEQYYWTVERREVPAFLVVRWINEIGFWRWSPKSKMINSYGGRRKENQRPGDEPQPMCYIPISEFKTLEKLK